MSYPRYFVTYAVMSEEAGSNPFWHSIIICSEQNTPADPIQVKDAIGYYSQPSTTTHPIVGALKELLGFKIDLQDGHGVLKKENLRDLDALGLYGKSFEVDSIKYKKLQKNYKAAMAAEKEAIEELNAALAENHRPQNGYLRYIEELSRAEIKARQLTEESNGKTVHDPKPRLNKFHITMDWSFNTSKSYACKNRALDLLIEAEIIDSKIYQELLGGNTQFAFPRFPQKPIHPIQLVSTGKPIAHTSDRTGRTHWARSWDNEGALFWTREPTAYDKPNLMKQEFRDRRNLDLDIKNILFHTRAMEKLLLRKIPQDGSGDKENYFIELKVQLQRIQSIYEMFRSTSLNQGELSIRAKLIDAEIILDIAKISLTPKTVNYSFFLRAFHNISMRYALLGLLLIPITATIFTGLVSIAATVLTTIFTIKKIGEFIQAEIKDSAMRQNYINYHRSTQENVKLKPSQTSPTFFSPKSNINNTPSSDKSSSESLAQPEQSGLLIAS